MRVFYLCCLVMTSRSGFDRDDDGDKARLLGQKQGMQKTLVAGDYIVFTDGMRFSTHILPMGGKLQPTYLK